MMSKYEIFITVLLLTAWLGAAVSQLYYYRKLLSERKEWLAKRRKIKKRYKKIKKLSKKQKNGKK